LLPLFEKEAFYYNAEDYKEVETMSEEKIVALKCRYDMNKKKKSPGKLYPS
jgi:hypothetical protein